MIILLLNLISTKNINDQHNQKHNIQQNETLSKVNYNEWVGIDNTIKFDPKIRLKKINSIRLRPNIYSLSKNELNKFLALFKKLNSGPRPTFWDQFTKLHLYSYYYVHLKPYFLAWHRAFIFKLEEAMREIDPSVQLPYWDWTQYHSQNPFHDPIFSPEYFGGDGDPQTNFCIKNGPFSAEKFKVLYNHERVHNIFENQTPEPNLSLPKINEILDDDKNVNTLNLPICVRRKFKERNVGYMVWNSIGKMKWIQNSNIENFWHYIERGGHGYVHNAVGSQKATDPLFFVLHGFVDKLWFDWQNNNPSAAFSYPVDINTTLHPFSVTVKEVMDPVNNLGYGYKEFKFHWKNFD